MVSGLFQFHPAEAMLSKKSQKGSPGPSHLLLRPATSGGSLLGGGGEREAVISSITPVACGAGNARMEAEPTGVPRMENSPGEEVGVGGICQGILKGTVRKLK